MVWVGWDLKDHLFPGHLPLDQVAQSPVHPGLERLQGLSIYTFSGHPVPVTHHPCSEEFLWSKSALFQLEAITPCPVAPCPFKNSLSSSLLGPFRYWQAAIRSPWSLGFSRLNSPNSVSLSSQQRCSSPHVIAMACSGPTPAGPCPSCAEGSSWLSES